MVHQKQAHSDACGPWGLSLWGLWAFPIVLAHGVCVLARGLPSAGPLASPGCSLGAGLWSSEGFQPGWAPCRAGLGAVVGSWFTAKAPNCNKACGQRVFPGAPAVGLTAKTWVMCPLPVKDCSGSCQIQTPSPPIQGLGSLGVTSNCSLFLESLLDRDLYVSQGWLPDLCFPLKSTVTAFS